MIKTERRFQKENGKLRCNVQRGKMFSFSFHLDNDDDIDEGIIRDENATEHLRVQFSDALPRPIYPRRSAKRC